MKLLFFKRRGISFCDLLICNCFKFFLLDKLLLWILIFKSFFILLISLLLLFDICFKLINELDFDNGKFLFSFVILFFPKDNKL